MNKINLSAYQPITDIQDNIVFANNGNVVLCFEGNLPEIYSLSEKDFEDIAYFEPFYLKDFQGIKAKKRTIL